MDSDDWTDLGSADNLLSVPPCTFRRRAARFSALLRPYVRHTWSPPKLTPLTPPPLYFPPTPPPPTLPPLAPAPPPTQYPPLPSIQFSGDDPAPASARLTSVSGDSLDLLPGGEYDLLPTPADSARLLFEELPGFDPAFVESAASGGSGKKKRSSKWMRAVIGVSLGLILQERWVHHTSPASSNNYPVDPPAPTYCSNPAVSSIEDVMAQLEAVSQEQDQTMERFQVEAEVEEVKPQVQLLAPPPLRLTLEMPKPTNKTHLPATVAEATQTAPADVNLEVMLRFMHAYTRQV